MRLGGRALGLLAACALLVLGVAAAPAHAAFLDTIPVTETADHSLSENLNYCTGEGTGGEECPLRAAVEEAAAVASVGAEGIEVLIPEGEYNLTKATLEVGNTAAHACSGSVCPITLQGAGAGKTVIDGLGLTVIRTREKAAGVVLERMTLTGSSGGVSGGPAVVARENAGLELRESMLTKNDEGGIGVDRDAVSAIDSVFSENFAAEGGAVAVNHGTFVSVRSTFAKNRAVVGGGAIEIGTAGSAQLIDSTVTGNKVIETGFPGGAIQAQGPGTSLDVEYSTIAGNEAPVDGGIHGGEELAITGSILSGNTNGQCGGVTAATATGANIVFGPSSCAFSGPAPLGLDPLLGALADNGGPAPTLALKRGSPAVNAGGKTCAGPAPAEGALDERRIARPQGAGCDLGAFEVGSDAAVALAASPEPVTVGSSLSLTATASDPGIEPITGVSLTFMLPSHTAFVSAPAGCVVTVGANSTVACPVGTLAPGQAHATTIAVRPEQAGALVESASVSAEQADAEPSNDSVSLAGVAAAPSSPGGGGPAPGGGPGAAKGAGVATLVGRTFTLDRHGDLALRLSCPGGGGTCGERVALFAASGGLPASLAKRAALLASGRASIPAGTTAVLRLRLKRPIVHAVRSRGSLRARVLLSANPASLAVDHRYAISIKSPRAHGR